MQQETKHVKSLTNFFQNIINTNSTNSIDKFKLKQTKRMDFKLDSNYTSPVSNHILQDEDEDKKNLKILVVEEEVSDTSDSDTYSCDSTSSDSEESDIEKNDEDDEKVFQESSHTICEFCKWGLPTQKCVEKILTVQEVELLALTWDGPSWNPSPIRARLREHLVQRCERRYPWVLSIEFKS